MMKLTLYFHNGKTLELLMSPERIMDWVEAYTEQNCYVMCFAGTNGSGQVYIPLPHVNYFEVNDVPEKLSEPAFVTYRPDQGPGVQPDSGSGDVG